MADRYCDPSLGGTTTAAGTAPTGGYADDGDGNATSRATAGTVVITVTDYTQWVAGSDSLSVIGATAITIAAPSSNNDMASKLATAINASTATNGNSTVNPRTAQLRNLVNAVASGAVVTIYTRTGGTAWHSLTCTTTKAAAFSTSFPVTFSGATAGAWHYMQNAAAAWPQSLASGTYGLRGSTLPFTGALTAGDIVYVRANNTTITFTATFNLALAAQGSASAPITYVIDNGVKWADGADKALTFAMPSSLGAFIIHSASGSNCFSHVVASVHSTTGAKLLKYQYTGVTAGTFTLYHGGPETFENVEFSVAHTAHALAIRDEWTIYRTTFKSCVFMYGGTANMMVVSNGNGKSAFIGCEFSGKTSAGTQNGAACAGFIANTSSAVGMTFVGCKFTDWITGSALFTAASAGYAGCFDFINCSFGGITVRSPGHYTGAAVAAAWAKSISIVSQYDQRDWTFDCQYGIAEWNSSRSFPTRNALQVDGVTKWSIRFCASTVATNINRSTAFNLPRIGKINSLADGTRTVTVHFVLEKSLTWTASDISAVVQYTNTSGQLVTVDSFDYTSAALATDVAGEWSIYGSGADANNVVWNNAGNIYHKQYKIALSCPAMAADKDVGVFLRLHTAVAATTLGGFLDPDFDIV